MNDKNKKVPKRITLSIPKGYENEYEFLDKQINKSQYIWSLIRKDMEQTSTDNKILEIVYQAMTNLTPNTMVSNSQQHFQPSTKKTVNLDESKLKKGAMSILQQ